jgi:hypothetical protein
LADSRQSEAAAEAGETPSTSNTPQYIIGPLGVCEDEITLADSVSVAAAGTSGSFFSPNDSVSVSDKTFHNEYSNEWWEFGGIGFMTYVGAAQWSRFVSTNVGSCHGFLPKQPMVMGFFEMTNFDTGIPTGGPGDMKTGTGNFDTGTGDYDASA